MTLGHGAGGSVSGAGADRPGGQAPHHEPSQADVLFGRACLSFGLVSREQLLACVADQRRLGQQGRPYTLAQVMIGRKLMTADVYKQVVERIRQRMHRPQAAGPAVEPPDITASGRYFGVGAALGAAAPGTDTSRFRVEPVPAAQPVAWGAMAHSDDEIQAAARSWEHASSEVGGSSYEVIAEPYDSVEAPRPVALPGERERKDSGIRRLLGVDEQAEQFAFGPYRILGEVAAGGMGVIYRAQDGDTGRVYALKALINVEKANEKQLRRFIQEAQSAMRLDHPGIVRIHDIGIYENIPYFTMDLIEGQDLQHHLRGHTLSLLELLGVVVKVCDAVHYAHEHAVIHRDLKPANIIVRQADCQPILTDFGLAKNMDSSFKLTAEGAMVGTPLFLSPEQVSGKGHAVDRRCDVYGLGVMLYQILTDRLPFTGRNPYEVYRKVLEEDPVPPRQHNEKVAPDLERICLMALAKDREERYPTAAELGQDIERFLRGEPVVAELPTPAKSKLGAKGGKSSARTKPQRGASTRAAAADGSASKGLLAGLIVALVMLILGGLGLIVWLLSWD